MTKQVNNYLADLNNIARKWKNNVIDPFCLAYIDAHANYTKTLKKQKMLDKQQAKQQAELAYLALSLMGGSILTELFRKATVSLALKEAAISAMFKTNSMKAFNIMSGIESNSTANFIIGSLYANVSGQLKKEVVKGVQKSIKNTRSIQLKSPLEVRINFEHYLRGIIIQAADFAKNIRDNQQIKDEDKNKIIQRLRSAPIANAPTSPIGKPRAIRAKDIELLFYMNLILNSDYLKTTIVSVNRGGSSTITKNHGAIKTAPSSDSYPQSINTVKTTGFWIFSNSVTRTIKEPTYHPIGKALESRLEKLYKERTGNAFYQKDDSDVSILNGIMGRAEMIRAEEIIKKLARENEIKLYKKNMCY